MLFFLRCAHTRELSHYAFTNDQLQLNVIRKKTTLTENMYINVYLNVKH